MDKEKQPFPEKNLPLKPLSMTELEETMRKRASLIVKEFRKGFDFIKSYPQSVSFFGSARFSDNNPYYIQAQSLAKRIVEETGFAIVTGGGPGIMEAGNRGASDGNGQSLGITIELPHEQTTNEFVEREQSFHYFFSRKVMLTYAAEAYVFFPGGFGTMDEFFEIITLIQTNKIAPVPIILVGGDFWNNVKTFLESNLLSRKTIDQGDLNLFTITDDEDEILSIIKQAPIRTGLSAPHKEKAAGLAAKVCMPCDGGLPPLEEVQIQKYLQDITDWSLNNDATEITKHIKLSDFTEAVDLINEIGDLAEKEGHHPDLSICSYNNLTIMLSTHAIKGLSENDFILAAKIDELLK